MFAVAGLIKHAQFTDHEIDAGTSGFCAMFALALFRVLARQNLPTTPRLVLLCLADRGQILRDEDHSVWWKHAAILHDGAYFDIEGRQEVEWLTWNYHLSYGSAAERECLLMETTPREFIQQLRRTPRACDRSFYLEYKRRLERAIEIMGSSSADCCHSS